MSVEYAVKTFGDDIAHLRGLIAEMGGLAEASLRDAMEALVKGNLELASVVIDRDRKIDAFETEIDRLAVRTMEHGTARGDDLRELIAALKIAGVIERIGDYAKNIAKSAAKVGDRRRFEPLTLIPAMADVAAGMVHDVLTAFAARDAELAREVVERDAKVDAFYDSLFRNLVSYMIENPSTISSCAQLLFVARNIERIGDHATNVAEIVFYAATGNNLTDREERARP